MKNISKNLTWALFIFILITVAFGTLFDVKGNPTDLTINQVVSKIQTGEVKSIVVSGEKLDITLQDDTKAVAQKEAGTSFVETLINYGLDPAVLQKIEFKVETESGFGYWAGVILPSLLPILIMVLIFWWIFRKASTGVNQAFSFGKANIKLFSFAKDKITFKDVAGLREAKEELQEVVDFLKNPKKFLDIGAKIPRGVLLMGHPGTGKTMLARAVAGEGNVPFFHIAGSEFVEMFVGVGSSRVRDLFETAKRSAPCIIFIDEVDAIGRERGAGIGGGHDEREQTLNQILVEMDGFERDTKVIVMAATNRPDVLDRALLRPGRFDRRIMLDMPDIDDREEILRIHSKGKPLEVSVDFKMIAVRTPGFAGADLANIMNEGAILAARANRKIVIQEDLLNAIEKVMLGPERRPRTVIQKEKEITAYHEAGHALVSAGIKEADPVHKVSIVSRGMAGGYTLKLPFEERRLKTKNQFLADLAVAFGGFAAESIIFKDVSTGSSNDLRQATDIAHRIVTQYGMSEHLGPRAFGKGQELIFLGREIATEKDYSESIATKIDEEVNALIARSLATAKKVIIKQKIILEKIAQTLLEKETIEHEDFYALMNEQNLKPISIALSVK